MSVVNRVAFLVDGFNLYHSLKSLSVRESISTKWLNIKALCDSYLYLLNNQAVNVGVYYFSALAYHLQQSNPGIVRRHQSYLECLTDSGVNNQMARFKKKIIFCPYCGKKITRREEKETDVAISVKVLELFIRDACDSVVILTGDTDVAPAIRTARTLYPDKDIHCLFPYDRLNNELTGISTSTFQISRAAVLSYQFADPYICRNGRSIAKPATW